MKNHWNLLKHLPLVVLILSNMIPLWGVVFAGWDAFYIVLLYWSENLAVGFYNILKIASVKVKDPKEHLGKLFAIPFFAIHFGGFMAIHGVFVLTMFKRSDSSFMHGTSWPCFLVFIQMLVNVVREAYSLMTVDMRLGLLALFISHGVSFVYNYLIKGEYATITPPTLMMAPYARVVVMHVAILAGGFLLIVLDSPIGLLLTLVVLKTIMDIILHRHEHRKNKAINRR